MNTALKNRVVHQSKQHNLPNGRGSVVNDNIVKTYQLGNTTVHICSDHFATTPEEVAKVIEDMHTAGWEIVDELVQKGEEV